MNCTILFMPRNIFISTKSTIHQNDMSSHLMFFQQRNMFIHTDLLIILRWNVWINCDIWTRCSWSFWNFSVILFFLEANDQIANEQFFFVVPNWLSFHFFQLDSTEISKLIRISNFNRNLSDTCLMLIFPCSFLF